MKIDSKECRLALEKLIPETDMEKLAIRVLLTDSEEVVNLPGMMEMSHAEIDLLVFNISKMRKRIGIEDEA